jgi:hypothetical protein
MKVKTSANAPTVVVRIRVPPRGVEPYRMGDGEVGFGGFRRSHIGHMFDMRTGALVSSYGTGACFGGALDVPADDPGEYCVVITPADPSGYESFEIDYAAGVHSRGLVQMPEDEYRANVAAICARAKHRASEDARGAAGYGFTSSMRSSSRDALPHGGRTDACRARETPRVTQQASSGVARGARRHLAAR